MAFLFGGGVKATMVANKYNQTIWVKCDVEKQYPLMLGGEVMAQLNFAGVGVGGGTKHCSQVQWNIVQAQFSPIMRQRHQKFVFESKGCRIVYITIVADNGKILCDTLPRRLGTNVVVAECGTVVTADEENPFKQMSQAGLPYGLEFDSDKGNGLQST